MKLLIVENNAGIRRLIASMLAPLTQEIVECSDGAFALAPYEAHHPDVVLMDIVMRQLDGITATATLRSAHPEARVVIVTNHDDADLREAARVAGACGSVLKENLLDLAPLLERLGR